MFSSYESNANEKSTKQRNFQERSVPKFLKKIFYILQENKHNEFVSWSTDGQSVIVKKPTEFAEKVLPLYFKHNNLASFVRQLNMYNFKKRKNYNYDHEYAHEMFQRGRVDLLRNIFRKAAEITPAMPATNIAMDIKSRKEDLELDVDELIQENMNFKRLHKTLLTQVQFIENKMTNLKTEISELNAEQQKLKSNEDFLKKVIKNLSIQFGAHNIQKVIEEEILLFAAPEQDEQIAKPTIPMRSRGNSYTSVSTRCSIADDLPGYDQFSQYERINGLNACQQQPASILMDNGFENCDNTQSCSNDTYGSWVDEFEKQQHNADAFLGTEDNFASKKLEIDDFFYSNNALAKRDGY